MAKTKKIEKEKKEIVLNFDTFVVPLSIVIAGVIIAVAILITNSKGNGSNSLLGDTENNAPTTLTAEEEEGFPAVKISIDDDAYLGDKSKAKVAIVEFSDYECSYCQRHFQQTHSQLVKEYVDTGKAIYVFRDLPLSFHDPKATQEAMAAECVGSLSDNKTYFKYHDLIFTNTPSNGQGLSDEVLIQYAKEVGVDTNKFSTCLANSEFADEIAKDIADANAAGINGTPGFAVGILDSNGNVTGKLIAGAYPFDSFKQILDEYLK